MRCEDGSHPGRGTNLPEVHRIDNLIVSVLLIAIQVFGLATVTGIVEEERIVWSRILDKPVHRTDDVLLDPMPLSRLKIIVCFSRVSGFPFSGSLPAFLAAFSMGRKLTDAERELIQQIIDQAGEG